MRALLVALVLVVGCMPQGQSVPSQPGQPTPGGLPTERPVAVAGPVAEFRSSIARQPVDASTADQLASLVAADRDFAMRLYAEIVANEPGNIFISPYSISTALSMVYAGSQEETAEQIAAVLGIGSDGEAWHAARNRLELELADLANYDFPGEGETVPMTLEPTNAMFGLTGYPFKAPFLDTLAANYGAGMHAVDFERQTEEARQAVNQWVSDKTHGRIEELLQEGDVNSLTAFVLVNAIYFKANWVLQFDPSKTVTEPFHLLDGTAVDVPMMHSRSKMNYASGGDWEALELPYHGASMIVIVPAPGKFAEIEIGMDAPFVASVVDGLAEHEVTLGLPSWESETRADLIPPLESMGIVDLFDDARANLRGIADIEQMWIEKAIHMANVTVDETGTEAAAATALVGQRENAAAPVTLTVDRPFIYLIRDEKNGEILFLGRLLEP